LSTPLDRFLKIRSEGPDGVLDLDDWNGLIQAVGGMLAEMQQKAAGFDAVSKTAIEILLKRVNDVLGPAFLRVNELGDQAEAKLAIISAGVSADIIHDGALNAMLTVDQRAFLLALPDATAAALAAGAAAATRIGARDLYLSSF
jgi:hypothetical protein